MFNKIKRFYADNKTSISIKYLREIIAVNYGNIYAINKCIR